MSDLPQKPTPPLRADFKSNKQYQDALDLYKQDLATYSKAVDASTNALTAQSQAAQRDAALKAQGQQALLDEANKRRQAQQDYQNSNYGAALQGAKYGAFPAGAVAGGATAAGMNKISQAIPASSRVEQLAALGRAVDAGDVHPAQALQAIRAAGVNLNPVQRSFAGRFWPYGVVGGIGAGKGAMLGAESMNSDQRPDAADQAQGWSNFLLGQGAGTMGGGVKYASANPETPDLVALSKILQGGQGAPQNAIAANPSDVANGLLPATQGAPGAIEQHKGPNKQVLHSIANSEDIPIRSKATSADAADALKAHAENLEGDDLKRVAKRLGVDASGEPSAVRSGVMDALERLKLPGRVASLAALGSGGLAAALSGSTPAEAVWRKDESLPEYKGRQVLNFLDNATQTLTPELRPDIAYQTGRDLGSAVANQPGRSVVAPPYNPRTKAYSDYVQAQHEAQAQPQGNAPIPNDLMRTGPDAAFHKALLDFHDHFSRQSQPQNQ